MLKDLADVINKLSFLRYCPKTIVPKGIVIKAQLQLHGFVVLAGEAFEYCDGIQSLL